MTEKKCALCGGPLPCLTHSQGLAPAQGATGIDAAVAKVLALGKWPINGYQLYRCTKYSSRLGGYVVYRNVTGQEPFEPSQDYLDNHKTAVFVTENEAKHYCKLRNELTAINGDDAVGNDKQ